MAKLSELIERVEKATGPDRELDAAIVAWQNNAALKPYPPTDDFGPKNRWQFWSKDGAHFLGNENRFPVPAYTTSLDAVVALVEKELPGAVWHVMTDYGGLRRAKIGPAGRPSASIYNYEDRPLFVEADAETPPLALLLAFLKSHEGKQ